MCYPGFRILDLVDKRFKLKLTQMIQVVGCGQIKGFDKRAELCLIMILCLFILTFALIGQHHILFFVFIEPNTIEDVLS